MPGLKFASRSAGKKLAVMLLLLLIPVGALLYLFVARALTDIRLVERQSNGTQYLQQLLPVYAALVSDAPLDNGALSAVAQIPGPLALRLPSLKSDAEKLASSLGKVDTPRNVLIWRMRALIQDTAAASEFTLASAMDRHSLANAVSTQLPDLALLVSQAAMEKGLRGMEGEFSLLRSAAFAAVSGAIKSDGLGDLPARLNDELARFDDVAGQFAGALRERQSNRVASASRAMVASTTSLAGAAIEALRRMNEMQSSTQRFNLLAALAAVGLATVLALSFAFNFVGRIFRQLDVVEAAKLALERSESESRAFAAEMQKLNGEVAALNKDLQSNYAMLQQTQEDNIKKGKMAQLGSLTAMVAHELRNPLGAVRNSAFHIGALSRRGGWAVERQLERINNAVVRCDGIISQLLNYSNSNEVHMRPTVLAQWLPRALESTAQDLPDWLEIDFEDHSGGEQVLADTEKLQHVVANILLNSAQAIAGDRTTQRAAGAHIHVQLSQRHGGLQMQFADTGPGIATDKLTLVTEPLFTTKSFGPGLGLAIAEQIIKLHRGELTIRSEEGQGTTVSIFLPLAARASQAA